MSKREPMIVKDVEKDLSEKDLSALASRGNFFQMSPPVVRRQRRDLSALVTPSNAKKLVKGTCFPSKKSLDEAIEDGGLFENRYYADFSMMMSPRTILELGSKAIGEMIHEDDEASEEPDVGMGAPVLALSDTPGILPFSSCNGHGEEAGVQFWAKKAEWLSTIARLASKHGMKVIKDVELKHFALYGHVDSMEPFSMDLCAELVDSHVKGFDDPMFFLDQVLPWLGRNTLTSGQKNVLIRASQIRKEFDAVFGPPDHADPVIDPMIYVTTS